MKIASNKITFSAINLAIFAVLFVLMSFAPFTNANPLAWIRSSGTTCQTAAATTTVTYMSPGTATTTLTCDTYALGSGSVKLAPDSIYVRVYEAASSTASIQAVRFEWSDDGVDYYADNALTTTDTASSTNTVGDYKEYRWNYASTTPGAAAVGNSNTGLRTIEVPVKGRYVRAMFYVPVGATNSSIWAGITAKRQEK